MLKEITDNVEFKSKRQLIFLLEKNNFNDFADLKKTFNSVDKVGDKYVFDIGGNKLRLIASIHFNRNKLYIREILTHIEYEKGKWRKENGSPAIKRKAGRKKS